MVDISNNSYLIIVWGSQVENVNIVEYKEPDKTKIEKTVQNAVSATTDVSINSTGKAIINSYFSPIAQQMASKLLPPSVLGRANSSIAQIIKDGKINNTEVFESFKTSCTSELDSVASGLGLPSPSALYDLIKPSGSGLTSAGINPKQFTEEYAKTSEKLYDELNIVKNNKSVEFAYIKLKLCTSESESYSSSLPRRRTEKGFNVVDYVNNEDLALSFDVLLGGIGNDTMYQIQDALVDLRNSKTPFDVYKIDKINNKQVKYKRCLFSSLEFGKDNISANTKTCSMSFEEIPDGKVEVGSITGISGNTRSGKSSGKSVKQKANTTPAKQGSKKVKVGTPSEIARDNKIIDSANKIKNSYANGTTSKQDFDARMNTLEKDAKAKGTSFQELGIKRDKNNTKRVTDQKYGAILG